MMDLGNNCVCEECTMICSDMYSDNEDKEIVVYGDQVISLRKYEEDIYGGKWILIAMKKKSLIIMRPYVHKIACRLRRNKDG